MLPVVAEQMAPGQTGWRWSGVLSDSCGDLEWVVSCGITHMANITPNPKKRSYLHDADKNRSFAVHIF